MKRTRICNLGLGVLATLLTTTAAFADTNLWTGLGPDQNWSTGANWTNSTTGTSGTAPGALDDAWFFDSSSTSPSVDGAFGGTVGSLWFGSVNSDYTTTIAGRLDVTGAGGMRAGTNAGGTIVRTFSLNGGTLSLSNSTASLAVNQCASTGAGNKAILNLEGLNEFRADLDGLGIGSGNYPTAVNDRCSGDLHLARTNLIVLHHSLPLATYETTAARNALEMGQNTGNNPGTRNFFRLGVTNAFFVDSLGIGKAKASTAAACTMHFNPTFLPEMPVAYFRGTGGDASRVTWWALGDMGTSASSSQVAYGTNDFTGGQVDALVESMSLGRDCVPEHKAGGSQRYNIGVLTFDNGIIDVNTLYVGNQVLGPSTSTTPNHGYVGVNGPNATLVVNHTLALARTTQNSTAAQQTHGWVTVNGGALRAHTVTVGANTVTNAVIDVSNSGRFVLSNTLASATKPLYCLSMADSTLELHLTGAAVVGYVTNLLTSGSGNTLNIGSSIVFPSYPAQVTLFKYSTLSNDVAGNGTHNFTLGSVPGNVVGAYLTNNTFNSSLDLYIPTDPRPVITSQPSGFAGAPGSTVTMTVGVAGVTPFTYQWQRDNADVMDSGNVSGATTETLSITDAQPANNGAYTVIISNAYGTTTSAPPAVVTISAGNVAPTITGPADQSVIQGNDATFTASVSGVPAPTLRWFKNGVLLPGESSATLTVTGAQYPADETTYAIVATNIAGVASNWARLTVIVPPGIASEPVSATAPQGSPAAFTVVATGHPAPTFQWSKNNNAILDATNAALSFASVQPGDAGSYAALVTNPGGATNSVTVTLTVTSTTLAYTNLTPASGTSGICYDTPLYLKFNTAPVLGAGTLRIYDSADTLVDTIDLGANYGNGGQQRTIAGETYVTYPVILRGNTAAIFPHLGMMTSNTTYYVLMDAGFFKDAGGASMPGISSPTAWRFTTKVVGPDPLTATHVVVAADGSGDFLTMQGAIDWVPAGNTTPITIQIRRGTYEEINRIPSGKNNLTFIGEGCQESVLTYANNNNLQAVAFSSNLTGRRIMFYAGGNGLVFQNLTFANSTPQGGSQAEALRVQGVGIIVDNCKLASFQDTILVNTANTSSGYFNKCLVQGDVDFIWGSGIAFFDRCELRAMQRAGNGTGVYTQSRTPDTVYGLIFSDCDVTRSAADMTGWSLGRDANTSGPYGNVAWLNCRMDGHISPEGWTDGGLADKSTLRFWEYQSRDITGTALVDVSSRAPWSRQLSAAEFDTVSNPTNVFASVLWEPILTPYFACQPANQSALLGQTVTLAAAVGGIPQPVYQWYHGASPVSGGTDEDLVIVNAQAGDAGTYSLRVTNALGYALSDTAMLTLTPAMPPTLTDPLKLPNGSFQFSFTGAAGQPYRIWASTDVSLTPVPSTWTLLDSGTFGESPVTYTDAAATGPAQRFYLISVP